MNGRYERFAVRQKELIAQSAAQADVRRRYLLDELSYALSEQFSLTGGKITFPPASVCDEVLAPFDREERAFLIYEGQLQD